MTTQTPSLSEIRSQLVESTDADKYGLLIKIGKTELRDLEGDVATFLTSSEAALRSAAIRVLAFYWGLPAYAKTAESMAWDAHEDEEARATALMSWGQYPQNVKSDAAVRRVHELLIDESAPPRVRAAAYSTLFLVADVPQSDRPKGTPLSATAPFDDGVDWKSVNQVVSTFGVAPVTRETSLAAEIDVSRIRYVRGSENKPMTHFGELELTLRSLGVVDLTQRMHGRRRDWNATLLPSTWTTLLQTLVDLGFPDRRDAVGRNVPGTEFTTIEWKRSKQVESISYPIGSQTFLDFDRLALSIIDQMVAGLLGRLPWTNPPLIENAGETTGPGVVVTCSLHAVYWGEGNVEDVIDSFFGMLRAARPDVPGLDPRFSAALLALVRLEDRQARCGRLPPERLEAFREEALAALTHFSDDIAEYVRHIEVLGEGAREDDGDWFKLCQQRSAVQILLNAFPNEPLISKIDLDQLSRIDEELCRIGEEQGPVAAEQVPEGISKDHWWWWHPTHQ